MVTTLQVKRSSLPYVICFTPSLESDESFSKLFFLLKVLPLNLVNEPEIINPFSVVELIDWVSISIPYGHSLQSNFGLARFLVLHMNFIR